jgi:hypothetical protein
MHSGKETASYVMDIDRIQPFTKYIFGPRHLRYRLRCGMISRRKTFRPCCSMSDSGREKLEKGIYEGVEYLAYHIGLTVEERLLLALHPIVKRVRVYPPVHAPPERDGHAQVIWYRRRY